jgi:copper chaperone
MHCTGCASRIKRVLERDPAVKRASVSFDTGEAQVLFDPQSGSEDRLAAAIELAGHRVRERSITS